METSERGRRLGLYAITAVFNPIGYKSRYQLYVKFRQHMNELGIDLITVECALGDQPFAVTQADREPWDVQVRSNSVLFLKENLLNIAVSKLPPDARHVAWIDCDITFTQANLAEKIVQQLGRYPVIQLFRSCLDLGPDGEVMQTHRSFASALAAGDDPDSARIPAVGCNGSLAHPGYAWAIRLSVLRAAGGFLETAILGGGDNLQARAFIGFAETLLGGYHEGYVQSVLNWQAAVRRVLPTPPTLCIGALDGQIIHSFHGTKARRFYIERRAILKRHMFDPASDLIKNSLGVFEVSSEREDLQRDIVRYFEERREDDAS